MLPIDHWTSTIPAEDVLTIVAQVPEGRWTTFTNISIALLGQTSFAKLDECAEYVEEVLQHITPPNAHRVLPDEWIQGGGDTPPPGLAQLELEGVKVAVNERTGRPSASGFIGGDEIRSALGLLSRDDQIRERRAQTRENVGRWTAAGGLTSG
jgi:alkylated DNA nucleotide flippase Atl1